MEPVIVIGAANDGELVVDLLRDINEAKPSFDVVGFLDDDPAKEGRVVNGCKVIGPTARHRALLDRSRVVLAVASPKRTMRTKRLVETLRLGPDRLLTLVHPQATVSRSARLGAGCVIMAGARVGPRARLGACVMVEGNAWLGVGTQVGDYAVVTHGASISGDCELGEGCYLGANCSVRGRIGVGAWAVVGMGAVVVRDVPARRVVAGNPAREIGSVDDEGMAPVAESTT